MTKVLAPVLLFIFGSIIISSCQSGKAENAEGPDFTVAVLPSSVRLDPVKNEIIEDRFTVVSGRTIKNDLLENNWIYDGNEVLLHGARGEYVSFQVVISNNSDSQLSEVKIKMEPFESKESQFEIKPEFFLEWSVEVKTPSTGYPKASLGGGWYPDALIPFKYIQDDTSKIHRSWLYPLWLPDFNNRIKDQRSLIIWIDQYIPYDYEDAQPGTYFSTVSVTIKEKTQLIPVNLKVWNFAIPNENKFKASLQHEGFARRMSESQELEVYQLLKRNRISLMDPTYEPEMEMLENGKVNIQWDSFDKRLRKYLTGDAFTSKYGYDYGPGYGEPIETFVLPFDVYGKHGTTGWPNIGKPEVERKKTNRTTYINTIRAVRNHLQPITNPEKTDIFVYLNGLDESYFPEAWDRMVYYGEIFKKEYPEAQFRVDGGYSEEAMAIIGNSINAWASHTINYNIDKIKKYQEMGIKDWLYGPMLYESKVNSWVGSSTFIDLPLVNDRAISWSSWKYRARSWISWGIGAGWKAAWYDPETWKSANDGGNTLYRFKKLNGNGQLIYSPGIVPNVNGPCPSIRLKTMRNGVQEYEYMRLLSQLDGNSDRVDKIVNSIIKEPFGDKAIGEFNIWSFDPGQWDKKRIEMGELIDQHKNAQ